jgi:hypothetical protein
MDFGRSYTNRCDIDNFDTALTLSAAVCTCLLLLSSHTYLHTSPPSRQTHHVKLDDDDGLSGTAISQLQICTILNVRHKDAVLSRHVMAAGELGIAKQADTERQHLRHKDQIRLDGGVNDRSRTTAPTHVAIIDLISL